MESGGEVGVGWGVAAVGGSLGLCDQDVAVWLGRGW